MLQIMEDYYKMINDKFKIFQIKLDMILDYRKIGTVIGC